MSVSSSSSISQAVKNTPKRTKTAQNTAIEQLIFIPLNQVNYEINNETVHSTDPANKKVWWNNDKSLTVVDVLRLRLWFGHPHLPLTILENSSFNSVTEEL